MYLNNFASDQTLFKRPICLNCTRIAIIAIKEKDIKIKCSCGDDKIMSIKDYLNEINKIFQEQVNNIKINFKENEFKYCERCLEQINILQNKLNNCNKCINKRSYYEQCQKQIEDFKIQLINCECCKKFLNKIIIPISKSLFINNDLIIPQCEVHRKEKEYYCDNCKEHLCVDCKNNHNNNHSIINLLSVISNININRIKVKIKEGEKYLNEYYPKIKKDYINKIEEEYTKSLEKNKHILELCSIFINNFVPHHIINYNLIQNIQNIHLNYKYYNENNNDFIYFLRNNLIYYNIDFDSLKSFKTITEHNSSVYDLIILKDGRLASCSSDKKIKIYDPLKDYHCDLTIQTKHPSSILSLSLLDDGRLISCSVDNTIKIWKINNNNTYQCLTTLKGHSGYTNKVISLPNNHMASCSDDKTIEIWSSNSPYQFIQTLTAHSDCVRSLLLMREQKYFISGSLDSSLRVWDVNTYKNEKTINNVYCYEWNSLKLIDNERVVIGGYQVINIVNISTSQIEDTIKDGSFGDICSLLLLRDGNILCGDTNGNIYYYDRDNKIIKKKEKCHNSSIWSLIYLNEKQFASCSSDKSIKLWN